VKQQASSASRRRGPLVQPLSERQRNVRRAAAIFSFSLHPLAKKISAKNFHTPRNYPWEGANDSHSIAIAACHRSDRSDDI
jgi:hypothetical protein